MNRETDVPIRPEGAQPTPAAELAEVDGLLQKGRVNLRFPVRLELLFRAEMALARATHFIRIALLGIGIYNSFLFVDWFILPDIFGKVVFAQLVVVSPILAFGLYLIHKRICRPEVPVAINLTIVMGSIIVFYSQSLAPISGYLIFTVPVCLAFGNIVLPLPFALSAWFTGFCIAASSAAVLARPNQDPALVWFAILTNANAGIYMLIATFRMELSERHAYLVNLREKLRAEILDANNLLLRNLSETDALTGIANRRAFDHLCDRFWTAARYRSEPMTLLMVDIDHFKRLNDIYGHQAGDRALRCIAQCLKQHVSPGSIVARYGGEEFAVLLSGGNPAFGGACAEVFRDAIAQLYGTEHGDALPTGVTVSIGLAMARPAEGGSCTDLIWAADQALYRAKAEGRNRVVSYESARARAVSPVQTATG